MIHDRGGHSIFYDLYVDELTNLSMPTTAATSTGGQQTRDFDGLPIVLIDLFSTTYTHRFLLAPFDQKEL